jgi:hypothetical protein
LADRLLTGLGQPQIEDSDVNLMDEMKCLDPVL